MTVKAPMNTSAARKSKVRPRLPLDQPPPQSYLATPAPVVYAGSGQRLLGARHVLEID
jgi:hypothetical protein